METGEYILIGLVGIGGYFAYQAYQNSQAALLTATTPMIATIPNPVNNTITTVPVISSTPIATSNGTVTPIVQPPVVVPVVSIPVASNAATSTVVTTSNAIPLAVTNQYVQSATQPGSTASLDQVFQAQNSNIAWPINPLIAGLVLGIPQSIIDSMKMGSAIGAASGTWSLQPSGFVPNTAVDSATEQSVYGNFGTQTWKQYKGLSGWGI